ncbi:hypothetical protein N3K66_005687 [Trichothecium roseum]|uniref:Uncharacterized protein n=1 Tax=Trichothecium roseum TaxID=47278 RepID=A0ACC0UYP6_9HYPO|nr:hypothetical protein N3K66_005687 [Trichothecium roseum]
MVQFSSILALAALALAIPQPQLSPDPSGEDQVGNGEGLQFITGGCLSDADCASGCCAGLAGGDAVCSGPAVSFAQGKQGCGFGGNGNGGGQEGQKKNDGNDDGAAGNEAGAENVGDGNGKQFITGQCLSDADCASGCCAGSEGSDTAACSAKAVANENGKTGCGFQGN